MNRIKEVLTMNKKNELSDKMLVQKSHILSSLWVSDLNLVDFKILDVYLGRINSHNEDDRTVVFKKGEIESILGVDRIKTKELKLRLKRLMSPVMILDPDISKERFTMISLFEKATAEKDDNGIWKISLTSSESAQKYIFNIEKIGYFKYKLKNIVKLRSRYSYLLFLLIEQSSFKKEWSMRVDDLKRYLNCQEEETYSEFKRFNDLILKKSWNEINRETDMIFDYETVKNGRIVDSIKFIYKGRKQDLMDNTNENPNIIDNIIEVEISDWCDLLIKELSLNDDQINEINDLMDFKGISDKEMYIKIKINEYNRYSKSKKVRNNFTYFLKMIENDVKNGNQSSSSKSNRKNNFNNFPQRKYDYDELEKNLFQ